MTIYPDFSNNGYQVKEQLNQNIQGGRVTYKAIEIATQIPVIIKQFRFATTNDWNSYKAIEREIEVLQGLSHPGIPKYLDRFVPGDGLCLVQQYINAAGIGTAMIGAMWNWHIIQMIFIAILAMIPGACLGPIFVLMWSATENLLYKSLIMKFQKRGFETFVATILFIFPMIVTGIFTASTVVFSFKGWMIKGLFVCVSFLITILLYPLLKLKILQLRHHHLESQKLISS